ncbi:MAG: hypothetical protein KOO60_11485 [Gemmatimonadales bacterium]|nr:hypothetical protein [Gemmatimonadales bacterium]
MNCRLPGWAAGLLVTIVMLLPATGETDQGVSSNTDGCLGTEAWTLLMKQSLPLRDDGSGVLQRARLGMKKAPSELNAILVMCDFSDSLMLGRHGVLEGDFPPAAQKERFYSAHDALYFDHQLSILADYFATVSGGRFEFIFTIHPRTVNLPEPMGYYGNHPEHGEQKIKLVAAVIDSLDSEIDFQEYDTVMVVHAGAGEETDILGDSPEQIYSSFLSREDFEEAVDEGILDDPYIPYEGYEEGMPRIDQVLLLPETEYQDPYGATWDGHFGSLGVYCFEVGLRLGMLSLSDFTPAGRPDSQGIGQYGLMGYGLFTAIGMIPPHPCVFNKYLMGWVDPVDLDPLVHAEHEMFPSRGSAGPGTVYRVSLTGQEYWLLEYRLQDPDGDRAFSFEGDLNGNHVYDYWDADAPDNRPYPGVDFDSKTDILERPLDGEWDFAMSENASRKFGELGFGSGVYIWHIDEGRIREVFDSPTNLFNSDPHLKSVDLEEADGIQDLDSAEPTSYWLGSDDDSYRAEGVDTFGPDTKPSTVTSRGSRTGIVFSEFSQVNLGFTDEVVSRDLTVVPAQDLMGIVYADKISFTLNSEFSGVGGPDVKARRELPSGVGLRGSHVLIADLDAEAGNGGCDNSGQAEIVLAGESGEVYVLDYDLDEYLDQDQDSSKISPFVEGTRNGEKVQWNLPPAVGDLDGDGAPEIVLTTEDGLFAFNPDGTPVRDAEAGAIGLYVDLPECGLPPVLIPSDGEGLFCITEAVDACVVVQENETNHLRLYHGLHGDPAEDLVKEFVLGPGVVPSPPVFAEGFLLVVMDNANEGQGRLLVIDMKTAIPGDAVVWSVDLGIQPGPFPVSFSLVEPDLGQDSPLAVQISGRNHSGEAVIFEAGFSDVRGHYNWQNGLTIHSPLTPGGAFVGDGFLGRAGHSGHWVDGWPRVPLSTVSPQDDSCAGGPLVVRFSGSDIPLWQYLFPVLDGRIFGMEPTGESIPFWPLGGPAQTAGTPAVGSVCGVGTGDLVAIGTFERIMGLDSDAGSLSGEDISSIFLWENVVNVESLWPMWGGSPWRNGSYDMAISATSPIVEKGSGLVSGSHFCYPSPLNSGPLYVRGTLHSHGRARVFVYNLEGQEITRTEWEGVSSLDPFSIGVDLGQAVTGLYLCRLEVEVDQGGTESSVMQFAIVR